MMDSFFQDVDPALTESIQKVVPGSILKETITRYDGPDSKTGHLGALVSLLSSQAMEQETSLASENEDRKPTIEVLGLCYSALNEWTAAAATWRKIVDIDDKVTLSDHPRRDLHAMFNLGIALNHLERYAEAEEVLNRLLPMLEAVPTLGKTSEQYAGSLSALMMAVGKQGRVEDARKLYSEHAAIIQQYDESEYSAHAGYAKKMLRHIEHEARER